MKVERAASIRRDGVGPLRDGRRVHHEMLGAGEMVDALAGEQLHVGVGARCRVDQRGGAAPVLVAGVGEEDLRHVRLVGEQPVGHARLRIALTSAAERKEVRRIEERGEPMRVA